VEIEWPSGKRQTLTNVRARQHLVIVEPDEQAGGGEEGEQADVGGAVFE
jgi:hypothetical protein